MAGYPHAPDCPFTLFRGSREQDDQWLPAREALQERLADRDDPPAERFTNDE